MEIAGIQVRTQLADTDALGTITGEIDRPGDALDTVVRKARLALSGSTCLGLASQGSFFFTHPLLPFATGIEMLAFVAARREVVVVQRTRLGPTNWSHGDLPIGGSGLSGRPAVTGTDLRLCYERAHTHPTHARASPTPTPGNHHSAIREP